MIIKNIVFIEAGSPGSHIFSKYPVPRLGSVLLATILKERGYRVRVFIEDLAEPVWSEINQADLVCLSTITSTAPRTYLLADRFRAMGLPVVLGGPHVTFLAEEALLHADFVIRGEGENSLLELLSALEKGSPRLSEIKGLSYRDRNGTTVHNPAADFVQDLDSLPEPDFSLVHKWKKSNIYPLSTSRGCPFGCKFCSVIQMFGRRYRFKSVEATLRELKFANRVSRATKFIVDDNFAADVNRTREILRGLVAEKIKMKWSTQVRVDVARDPELLRLMADSGCHTLYIGFESINPRTLEAYQKKQDLKDIIRAVQAIRAYGIHVHGMFVLGADTDDVNTIRKTLLFARKNKIDTVQFMILTPLPGTPLFSEMSAAGRLIHTSWNRYDAHHVVFRPASMSPLTLQVETFKAMAGFYSWKYILKHLATLRFHYAAIGMFGKTTIHRFMKSLTAELRELQSQN